MRSELTLRGNDHNEKSNFLGEQLLIPKTTVADSLSVFPPLTSATTSDCQRNNEIILKWKKGGNFQKWMDAIRLTGSYFFLCFPVKYQSCLFGIKCEIVEV